MPVNGPCKFFNTTGRCAKGGMCTFWHDPRLVRQMQA
eukprot:gene11883-1851_t